MMTTTSNPINMDSWKDVLLEWANCTGLLHRHYQKLNKIDINAFYGEFRRKTSEAPLKADELADLRDFVKAFYPSYTSTSAPHRVAAVHRWSLLLHYSCVQSPQPDIQQKCSTLSAATQQKMARFFTELISRPKFDHTQLSDAIALAVAAGGDGDGDGADGDGPDVGGDGIRDPATIDSTDSSPVAQTHSTTNSSCSDSEAADVASPLRLHRRTPPLSLCAHMSQLSMSSPAPIGGINRSGGGVKGDGGGAGGGLGAMQSPLTVRAPNKLITTPRTKMMDDFNWENRQLRARINTELDERLFLEGQVKQCQEKIELLVNERKKLTHDNHELKNQLLAIDTENVSPNRNHRDEQAKRRLRKDLADRERQINELTDNIERQQDANAALRLKVTCFETQLSNQEERSRELLGLVEEQRLAIDANDQQIAELLTTNRELELYMQELRRNGGESARRLPVPHGIDLDALDASTDFLDESLPGGGGGGPSVRQSPQTAPTTPENLGRSVIDMRLREQQMRCQQLEEQLLRQADDAKSSLDEQLAQHREQMTALTAELTAMRTAHEQLTSTCQLDHVQRMQQLTEALQALQHEHVEMEQVLRRERESGRLQSGELLDQVTRLNAVNADLLMQIGERDVRIDALDRDSRELQQRREQLTGELAEVRECVDSLRGSVAEHERVKDTLTAEEQRLRETMRGLETKVFMLEKMRSSLDEDSAVAQKNLQAVEQSLRQVREEMASAEAKVDELQEENERLQKSQEVLRSDAADAEKVRVVLEAELESLKSFNEDHILANAKLQRECAQLSEQLTSTLSTLARVQNENGDFRKEQDNVRERIRQLEAAAALFELSSAQVKQDVIDLNVANETLRTQLDAKQSIIEKAHETESEMQRQLAECRSQADADRQQIETMRQANDEAFNMNRLLSEEREQLLGRTAELGKLLIDQKATFDESDGHLRQKIAESELTLGELRSELVQITVKISSEAADIDRLRAEKQRIQGDLETNATLLSESTERCAQLEQRNSELEAAMTDKLRDLDERERSLSTVKETNESVEASLQALQQQHEAVHERIVELTAQNARLVEQRREHEEICTGLRSELVQSHEQNATHAANLVRLEAESKAHLAELEQRLQADTEARAECQAEIEQLTQSIADSREEHKAAVEALEENKRRTTAELGELEKQLAERSAEVAVLGKSKLEADERRDTLAALLEQLNTQHAADLQKMRVEREELECSMAAAQAVCVGHSQAIMQLSEEVQELKAERVTVVAEKAAIERHLQVATKELEARLQSIETECLDKVKEIDELRARSQELTQRDEQQTAQIAAERERMQAIEKNAALERAQQQERIDKLVADISAATERLAAQTTVSEDLETKLTEARSRIEQLETEHSALVQKHAASVQELESQNTENAEKWLAPINEIKQLTAELETVRTERKTIELQCTTLLSDVEQSNNRCDRLQADVQQLVDNHTTIVVQLEQTRLQQTAQLEEKNQQIARLEQQLGDTQHARGELDARCSSLTDQVTRLNFIVNDKTELHAMRDRLQASEDQCCVQIGEVKRLSREIESERELRQKVDAKCEDLTASIAVSTADLRTQMLEVSRCMRQIEEQRAERDALHAKIAEQAADHRQQLDAVNAELGAMRERCSAGDAQLVQLRAECVVLQQHAKDVSAQHLAECATYRQRQQELDRRIEQQAEERETLVGQVQRLEEEIGNLVQTRTAIELERGRLVAQQDEIAEESREESRRLADALAESAARNTQLVKQEAKIVEQSTALANLQRQLDEAGAERDRLLSEHAQQISAAACDKAEAEHRLGELTARCEEITGKLTASADNITARERDLNSELTAARSQITELERELERAAAYKATLTNSLGTFELKFQRLEEEKEKLSQDVVLAMASRERVVELEAVAVENSELRDMLSEWKRIVTALTDDLQAAGTVEAIVTSVDTPSQLEEMLASLSNATSRKVSQLQLDLDLCRAAHEDVKLALKVTRDELAATQQHADTVEQRFKADLQAGIERQQSHNQADVERLAELEEEVKREREAAATLQQQCDALRAVDQEHQASLGIFRSKLLKERERMAELALEAGRQKEVFEERLRTAEQRVTETRAELEGKLEKMKVKMSNLYHEESAKLKASHKAERTVQEMRHASDLNECKAQLRDYKAQIQQLSAEIFKRNEETLQLRKRAEQMRHQNELLRQQNDQLRPSGRSSMMSMRPSLGAGGLSRDARMMPAPSMSSLIKMEDEEGEQFTNTYLQELITGGPAGAGSLSHLSPVEDFGRESLSVAEMKQRNSMLPRHLRSSYAIQFNNDQFSTEDDIKLQSAAAPASLPDDSMFSTQSGDVRRNTLYKRPGPPTPSKHSARLSFGGPLESLSIFGGDNTTTAAARSNSPPPATSKLRAFFTSSKSSAAPSSSAASSSSSRVADEPSQPAMVVVAAAAALAATATSAMMSTRNSFATVAAATAAAAGTAYAIDQRHQQQQHRRTPSIRGRRIGAIRSPQPPQSPSTPPPPSSSSSRLSLSARRRMHRRSTLELRQQPGVIAAIERQLYEAASVRSPMIGSRAELMRTLRGTRLSFSSMAAAGVATSATAAASLASCSQYSPQRPEAPSLLQQQQQLLQHQQQQQRRRSAVTWRRTAGRRSSIIAEMRPQRPSIGSSARKRRTPGRANDSRWAHLQRARQQQRSQQFERGRTTATTVADIDGDADDDDVDDDMQLLTMDDAFCGATALDVAADLPDRWTGRDSGLSCAPDADFEYSQHSARSFERLLLVKPSEKPFRLVGVASVDACDGIDGDMDAVRDVDVPQQQLIKPQSQDASAESTVIWQYLDRTRSIESLRSSTSTSFRVGTIPVRKTGAGCELGNLSMASSRANSSTVSQRSADTTQESRGDVSRRLSRSATLRGGDLLIWTAVMAAVVGLVACALLAVLRS